MASINKQYAKEINERFGYLATWLPNVEMRVGDVGIIRDHIFERRTSLAELGIPVDVQLDPSAIDFEYTSSDAVTINVKAAARR
jgi:hypothetical protein